MEVNCYALPISGRAINVITMSRISRDQSFHCIALNFSASAGPAPECNLFASMSQSQNKCLPIPVISFTVVWLTRFSDFCWPTAAVAAAIAAAAGPNVMPNCSYRSRIFWVSGASLVSALISPGHWVLGTGYRLSVLPEIVSPTLGSGPRSGGPAFDRIIGIRGLPSHRSLKSLQLFLAKDIKQKRRSLLICINIRLTFIPKNVFAVAFLSGPPFGLFGPLFHLPQKVVIIRGRFWPRAAILAALCICVCWPISFRFCDSQNHLSQNNRLARVATTTTVARNRC